MTDIIDLHTHTVASMHAYSTIREMATAAKEKGLALLGISDHAPAMPGTFHEIYFHNFKVIGHASYGVEIMMGAELNVMDETGRVDLPEKVLKKLHYGIASLHDLVIAPGSTAENTAALVGAMKNPYVNIIGHPDNPAYPVDFDALARAAPAVIASHAICLPPVAITVHISSSGVMRTSTQTSGNTAIHTPFSMRSDSPPRLRSTMIPHG